MILSDYGLRSLQLLLLGCGLILSCGMPLLHGVAASTVGVAYGRNGDNLPSPTDVVSLLQSINVGQVRIYDTDAGVLTAFQGKGINLIVGVPNDQLSNLASASSAQQWVQDNIVPYASFIKCIAVGNEVLTVNNQYTQYLMPAMTNIHDALSASSLQNNIQVSTTHAQDVIEAGSYPPSTGKFQSALQDKMSSILQFLSQTGAPFLADVYPFFAYRSDTADIPLTYALFQAGTDNTDSGNGLHYTNLFDAQVDTLIAAMTALGYGDLPLVVTESGWPSQGDPSATLDNAKTYNNNLVQHVSSGTPKRPNSVLDTYIFALFNEDLKTPEYEANFGLYKADETKVYDITL